jgi:hypothetical protein
MAEGDASLAEVVGRQFERDAVSREGKTRRVRERRMTSDRRLAGRVTRCGPGIQNIEIAEGLSG